MVRDKSTVLIIRAENNFSWTARINLAWLTSANSSRLRNACRMSRGSFVGKISAWTVGENGFEAATSGAIA